MLNCIGRYEMSNSKKNTSENISNKNSDNISKKNSNNISENDFKAKEKNAVLGGTLYLVATPIGNLADISERALKVLREVDFVAAEDTRNSGQLLSRYGISKPMISYFEHNRRSHGEIIAARLEAGESCALVTDAGTPAVSDPGEDIVRLCAERGIPVTSIPGASASITALTLSALPTRRFAFEGFLPTNKAERRERISELSLEKRTVIFYEAPHRLCGTLSELASALGSDRRVTLCRELTKLNEEIERFESLDDAAAAYSEKAPRGEYVIVLEGCKKSATTRDFPEDILSHMELYVSGGMKKMDAIKACAADRGISKSEAYELVLRAEKGSSMTKCNAEKN